MGKTLIASSVKSPGQLRRPLNIPSASTMTVPKLYSAPKVTAITPKVNPNRTVGRLRRK